jgi:hypothetical protein
MENAKEAGSIHGPSAKSARLINQQHGHLLLETER